VCIHTHTRDNNDAIIKVFYIKYCKILNAVIQEAKKQHCDRLIAKSDNKIKTWNIIKQETGKIDVTGPQMPFLVRNNENMKDPEKLPMFSILSFFLSFIRSFFFLLILSFFQLPKI
jgi:hypothetical protein